MKTRETLISVAICLACIIMAGGYALRMRQVRLNREVECQHEQMKNIKTQMHDIISEGMRISLTVRPLFDAEGRVGVSAEMQNALTPHLEAAYQRFGFIRSYSLYDSFGNAFTITHNEKTGRLIYDHYQKRETVTVLRDAPELIASGNGYAYVFPIFDGTMLIGNVTVQFDVAAYLFGIYSNYLYENTRTTSVLSYGSQILTYPDTDGYRLEGIDEIVKTLDSQETGTVMGYMSDSIHTIPVISTFYKLPFSNYFLGLVISSDCRAINRSAWLFFILASLLCILLTVIRLLVSAARLQAMAKHKERIGLLKAVIDDLPIGLVLLDGENRPLIVNHRAAELMPDFFRTSSDQQMRSEAQLPPQILDQSENERIGNWNMMTLEKFGTEVTLLKNSSTLVINKMRYTTVALVDISEFEQMRLTAIRGERTKSELLSRIGKDFRRSIDETKAALALLLQRHSTSSELNNIWDNARFLSESIADMQDFGEIEAGQVHLEELPFDVSKAVDEVVAANRPDIDRKGLHLSVHLAPSGNRRMVGDVNRFKQVLDHLLSNAVKFTPSGEISINLYLAPLDNGKVILRCSVDDSGVGMSKKELKSLFTIDVREREGRSIGLGAVVASQLVNIMGGTIQASSPSRLSQSPDRPGTSVSFTIECHADIELNKKFDFLHITKYEQIGVLIVTRDAHSVQYQINQLQRKSIHPDVFVYTRETRDLLTNKLIIDRQRYQMIIIETGDSEIGFGIAAELFAKGLSQQFLMIMVDIHKSNYLRAKKLLIDYYLGANEDVTKIGCGRHFTGIADLKANYEGALNPSVRVLIAENNPLSQNVARMVFGALGFNIRCVTSAPELRQVVDQAECDIIFIDTQFPPTNAVSVTKDLREAGCNLPIIAMTATSDKTFIRNLSAAGINGFVGKPLNREEIRHILYKWFM